MSRSKSAGLTKAQDAFAVAYVTSGNNGTAAYKASHPGATKSSDENIAAMASKLLRLPKVKSRIAALTKKAAATADRKFNTSVDNLISILGPLADHNVDDYFAWGYRDRPRLDKDGNPKVGADGKPLVDREPWLEVTSSEKLSRAQKASIVGLEFGYSQSGRPQLTVKLADRHKAAREIGLLAGRYISKTEHSGEIDGPVQIIVSELESKL